MILDQIIENVKATLQKKLVLDPHLDMIKAKTDECKYKRDKDQSKSFYEALQPAENQLALIAEIKRASPSKGMINESLHSGKVAKEYEKYGASALSVLTEEAYFKGNLSDLEQVKQSVSLPVLRKDFIIHPYQVYESYNAGADAILLIVCALPADDLKDLYQCARTLMLDVLVEVHTKEDIEKIRAIEPRIIGINNRDLTTFKVDITTTARLIPYVRDRSKGKEPVIVSESGIKTGNDAKFVLHHGAQAILVGEAVVKSTQREELIGQLIHPC
ncbi:MAG: indole-3-glycerol phosphate synthase TrpC [bacterium]